MFVCDLDLGFRVQVRVTVRVRIASQGADICGVYFFLIKQLIFGGSSLYIHVKSECLVVYM